MVKFGMIPLIACCLFISGCRKENGVLDDFPPGSFNFIYVLNNNNNFDTITGEVSGPYSYTSNYSFVVRQDLSMDKSLKSFKVGNYRSIINEHFMAQVNTSSTIDFEEHDSDHLFVHFAADDTLSGSLTLTRKE